MRRFACGLLLVSACGSPPPDAVAPRLARAPVNGGCPDTVNVAALLTLHEHAFGSRAAVAGTWPAATRGTVQTDGKTGTYGIALDQGAFRSDSFVMGLANASGIDTRGAAWEVSGVVGVRESLTKSEALDPAVEAWLWRREYTTVPARAQNNVSCTDVAGQLRTNVHYARVDLGEPTLTFDQDTGALLALKRAKPDGTRTLTIFDKWSKKDAAGIRWPIQTTTNDAVVTLPVPTRGPACTQPGRDGEPLARTGAACTAPAEDRVQVRWPPGGVVRLPLMYLGGELLVSVKVEGRQVHAFLDSGAGITVVDSTLPIGKAFVPTSNVAAQGATQKLRVGLGELPVVDLGDLHVEHLPTASVPIPSLEAFGDKRPEIVLGYTFFALGAVRVDYTKSEIVLAERAESLVEAGSRSVPMRVLGGKLVADVTIDGQPAAIELDTGNAGGIDLTKRWASAHGLPGTHKHVTVRGQFGAGASETDDVFFRLGSAALGPLAVGDTLAQISEEPGDSTLAGLAGNQIFARCDAVVFDHARRTLWLEGACTNPTPQTRFGWRLTRKDDPAFASTPWVVRSLMPGGSADQAGLLVGDRLLTIGGKPAGLDVAAMWKLESKPAGTKIPLMVSRDRKTERMTLELIVPLR